MCNGGCCHPTSEFKKPPRVSFRIRRQYFDQIVAGTKKSEFRADKPYWTYVVVRLSGFLGAEDIVFTENDNPIAVFVCGKDVHQRYIIEIRRHNSAREGLGREPSDQERGCIGEGAVWEFMLGAVVE